MKYIKLSLSFLKYGFRNDTAYIGNFWAELLSTFFYVITFIAFINLLYAKVGAIGDYTKNDFLFMTLIGQFTFYTWATVFFSSMTKLIANVRLGSFDYLLLKPISSKFISYFSSFRPLQAIFVSLPNIILFCILIDWGALDVSIQNLIMGAVVWVSAMLVLNTIMMFLAYPVFTQGDANDLLNTSYSQFSITEIPYNILPKYMQFAGFTILPSLLATSGTAYVMLGKGSNIIIFIGSIIAAIVAVSIFNVLWQKALSSYTSASS